MRKGRGSNKTICVAASGEPRIGHRARGKKGRFRHHTCAEKVGNRTGEVREGGVGGRRATREADGLHGQRPVGWRARRPDWPEQRFSGVSSGTEPRRRKGGGKTQ